MSVKGKVAIVTGGGLGIGRFYCQGLAEQGAHVVVADIAEEAAKQTAAEIGGLAVRVDISDESSVRELMATAAGINGRIDALVNNAGLFADLLPRKAFDAISVAEWDRVMGVNLRGTWLCCKEAAPYFRKQASGTIVNIASNTVFTGPPGFVHYVASKGGIVALGRTLATEMGEFGVRVNTVTPGLTSSENVVKKYTPADLQARVNVRVIKREETPQDLVGTIVFLCSDDSAFITGQTINVDGGQVFR